MMRITANRVQVKAKIFFALSMLALLTSCEENTGTEADGESTTTELVDFSALNFESDAKFVGPRLHTIVSETYRNLEYIHFYLTDQGSTIETKMSLAGGGNPVGSNPDNDIDDLLTIEFNEMTDLIPFAANNPAGAEREDCGENEGLTTKFIDTNTNQLFDAGDKILRDYGNVGCLYNFYEEETDDVVLASGEDGRPAYWPREITGSIEYVFSSGDAATQVYQGTVTFGNAGDGLGLQVEGGLLDADETSDAEFTGSLTFDVNFATGDATFSNISMTIAEGNTSILGPVTLSVSQLSRSLNVGAPARDIITISGGVIESQISGQRFTFSTQPFNNTADELSGFSGFFPDEGSIVFEGGDGSAVRVRSDVAGDQGIVELDVDGDGVFNDAAEAEPNGWGWFIYGFLFYEGFPGFD